VTEETAKANICEKSTGIGAARPQAGRPA